MIEIAEIVQDFWDEVVGGKKLCIMPVPRLCLSTKSGLIAGTRFYPDDSINFGQLNIVSTPEYEWQKLERTGGSSSLGWSKSAATQIGLDDYQGHTLVAFPLVVNWNRFLDGDHDFHKDVMREASEKAEAAIDIIRFNYCRLDLPESLPGRAGSFNDRSSFSSAIFYDAGNNESYMIGAQLLTHLISCGLGLNIGSMDSLDEIERGEIGQIVRTALSLFGQAMEANSQTSKFVQAMSLLDYLSSPATFMNMKEAKKEIAVHVASDKTQYQNCLDRFQQLSGKKVGEIETGYRTLIVHRGERLENIIPDQSDRSNLFRELAQYIGKIIQDMIRMSDQNWSDMQAFREKRRKMLLSADKGHLDR